METAGHVEVAQRPCSRLERFAERRDAVLADVVARQVEAVQTIGERRRERNDAGVADALALEVQQF